MKVPAGSAFATVIVVSGSARVARLSHVAAFSERDAKLVAAKKSRDAPAKPRHQIVAGLRNLQPFMAAPRSSVSLAKERASAAETSGFLGSKFDHGQEFSHLGRRPGLAKRMHRQKYSKRSLLRLADVRL